MQELEACKKAYQQLFSEFLHEIKTPLAIIRTHLESEIGSEHVTHAMQKKLVEDVEEIVRVNALLNDMKMILSIEQEARKEMFTYESLVEVVLDVIERLEPTAQLKQQQITLQCEDNCMLMMDKNKLMQLFYNLIENAIKYSDEHKKIEVIIDVKQLSVAIKDRGKGVPKALQEKIFEPFYRIDTKRIEGSGLGLAVANAIVLLHQGTLSCQSRKKGGTTFSVRFSNAV